MVIKEMENEVKVAPHAGAWIEIKFSKEQIKRAGVSHPTRVRGLK